MGQVLTLLQFTAGFAIVALASDRIAGLFQRLHLPKITGYLVMEENQHRGLAFFAVTIRGIGAESGWRTRRRSIFWNFFGRGIDFERAGMLSL